MAETTPEMALVADLFKLYTFWTDGYQDSFAEYFDRRAYFMFFEDRKKFLRGISQLESALKYYKEDDTIWTSLGMNISFRNQYELSLSKMRAILNLY